MSWQESSLRWYGVLLLMTWGLAPLVRLLCSRLVDRGATIARPLALLGVVYPLWLLAAIGLLPYSTTGLWLTLAIGSVVGWVAVIRQKLIDRHWLRALLVAEAISLVAFAGYVWLRGFTPEILNTEKPMDAAFLAASARTMTIPPPDPWYAGLPINYYYLGYLLHGALSRMAAVPATTGFNLALATTFSATATAAAGTVYNATRPWLTRRRATVVAILGMVLLVIVGNLYAPEQLVTHFRETVNAGWWPGGVSGEGIGWRSSRIVCDGPRLADRCAAPSVETINEFPFFSFLLGDLHPHVMALPFTIVALALALNLLLRRGDRRGRGSWSEWLGIGATGVVVGGLYALNSWDFPTYLLIAAGALGFGMASAGARHVTLGLLLLVGASVAAWLPFILDFVPPTTGDQSGLPSLLRSLPVVPGLLTSFSLYLGERTSVGEFLTIFGVPYAFSLWLIGTGLWREHRGQGLAVPRSAVVFGILALATAIVLPFPLLVVCGLPLIGAIILLRRDQSYSPRTIATALFALGFALALAVEIVYIRDVFNDRMNTLFKIYYQIWTLFAIAAAVGCGVIWTEARPRWLARPALTAVAGLALAAGAVYPALASYRWTDQFQTWRGLDGIAYVGRELPDELTAIRWLQANAGAGDVLLEAAGCSYYPISEVPFDRASAFSGVPTVIGWGNHERQWRGGKLEWLAGIGQRQEDVARMFANPEGRLIERYGVTLLYVGRYERENLGCAGGGPYPAVEAPAYPGAGWEPAFAQGNVRIFRRVSPPGGTIPAGGGTPSP